jgi:epoxyqueuosine reductase QueG
MRNFCAQSAFTDPIRQSASRCRSMICGSAEYKITRNFRPLKMGLYLMVHIGQFEFRPGNGLCPAACPLHGPVSPD